MFDFQGSFEWDYYSEPALEFGLLLDEDFEFQFVEFYVVLFCDVGISDFHAHVLETFFVDVDVVLCYLLDLEGLDLLECAEL